MTKPTTNRTLGSVFLFLAVFLFGYVGQAQTLGSLYTQPESKQLYFEEGVDLKSALEEVEKHYDVGILYRSSIVEGLRVRQASKLPLQLEEKLSFLLEGTDLKFKYLNPKTYGIYKNTSTIPEVLEAVQQNVTGTVTDAQTGEPLPGVTIVVEGTNTGTTTDMDGFFDFTVPSLTETLVFSYIGYQTQEIPLDGNTELEVIMNPVVTMGEELVVVGYGTQRKGDVTGSAARVTIDDTGEMPNFTVLQSLQGQIPGVNISSPERPGQSPSLRIRGTNSLTASNNPLVVVDGIIYNGSITDFNTSDIETIDVLKGPSAAAVYGSRAANGVLIITTKTGTSRDKPQINFSTYVGIEEPAKLIPVLDGPGYVQKISDYNDILFAQNPNASPIELTNVEQENFENGDEIDWVDRSLRNGLLNNYHLNVSGQEGNTNYYVSGTYLKQEGIMINDNFERTSLNLNLTHDITDWLTLSAKTLYSIRDYSGLEADLTQASMQSPYGNFYDENGPGGYAFNPVGDPLGVHPLIRTTIDDVNKRSSLRGVFSSRLEVPFIEGLQWTLNYANNVRTNRSNRFIDNKTTSAAQIANGIATKANRNFSDWTIDNIINYENLFAAKHSIDFTLLFSREHRSEEFTRAEASGFFSQELGFDNLALGEIQEVNSNYAEDNSLAQMVRLNYSFDQKYAVTFTVRRDGYSAFSENNKYAVFPSVAIAWTPTNENFLQENSWLNYLKVRASYGVNGNQAISRYSSLSRIGTSNYLFGNDGSTLTTVTPATLGNSDLRWETTTSRNFGAEFEIFDNRISGSFDLYFSNTEDLLQRRSIPEITGFGSVLTNIGETENKGVEVSLGSENVRKSEFSWRSNVTFSLNRNEIVTLGGVDADGDGVEDDDIANGWFIGEPISAIYGFETDGIYQLDDDIPSGFQPGDFRLVDTNGDGKITPEDRTILGANVPNYRVSLSNTLNYKQFTFYFLINAIQGGGNNYYVGNNFETRSVNRLGFTTFSERFNLQDFPYWTTNNPTNRYPRLDYSPPFAHPILEDRSFIRIQDISLSYNFSQSFLNKSGLRGLKLYATVKNLHTFTDWSGYNPESQSTIQDFPFLRSYTVGLDVSF